jgi:hypothetical protein
MKTDQSEKILNKEIKKNSEKPLKIEELITSEKRADWRDKEFGVYKIYCEEIREKVNEMNSLSDISYSSDSDEMTRNEIDQLNERILKEGLINPILNDDINFYWHAMHYSKDPVEESLIEKINFY